MKKLRFKKGVGVVLSIIMVLSFSLVSFADVVNHEKDGQIVEPLSDNRYYYETVRETLPTQKQYISASQAADQNSCLYASAAVLCIGGPIGAVSGAAAVIGNYIYDRNIAGYVESSGTSIKKYRVHRLTGKRTLDSESREIKVKVYAQENSGYSLHRSFSFTFRLK